MSKSPARSFLRAATAECHQRVDAVFSTAKLNEAASYSRFLTAQAAAHLPAEAALSSGGIDQIVPDWTLRIRAPLLVADLAALGAEPPQTTATLSLRSPSELLGALYVLEGSRLGGALLKRSVPAHLPTQFLGTSYSASWQSLLAQLDAQLGTQEKLDEATAAAQAIFALFEDAGRRYLPVQHSLSV